MAWTLLPLSLLILFSIDCTFVVVYCQTPAATIQLSSYHLDLNAGILGLTFDVTTNLNEPLQNRTRDLDFNLDAVSYSNCAETCSNGTKEIYYFAGGEKTSFQFSNNSYSQDFNLSPSDFKFILLHESIARSSSESSTFFIRIENSQTKNFISDNFFFFKQEGWSAPAYTVLYTSIFVEITNSTFYCTMENKLKFDLTWNTISEIQPDRYEISLRIFLFSVNSQYSFQTNSELTFTYQTEGNSFETILSDLDFEEFTITYYFSVRPLPFMFGFSGAFSTFNLINESFFEDARFKFGIDVFTVTFPIQQNIGVCSRVLRENLRCSNLTDGNRCYNDFFSSSEVTLYFQGLNFTTRLATRYDSQERSFFGIGHLPMNTTLATVDNGTDFTFVRIGSLVSIFSFFDIASTHVFNKEEIAVMYRQPAKPLEFQPFCAHDIPYEHNLIRIDSTIDFGSTCNGIEYLTISAIGRNSGNLFTTRTQLATAEQFLTAQILSFRNGYWRDYFDSETFDRVNQNEREELEIVIGRYCPSSEIYTLINTNYFLPFIAENQGGIVLASAVQDSVIIELRRYGFCFRNDYFTVRQSDFYPAPGETLNFLELTLENNQLIDVAEKIFAYCTYGGSFNNSIFYICSNLTVPLIPQLIYSGQLNISSDSLEKDVIFGISELKVSSLSATMLPTFTFPYGSSAGDSEVPNELNVCGEELRFSIFLPAGESIQTSAYVGSNGFISLGSCSAGVNPRTFPDTSIRSPILAAYWAAHDHREFGDVYYRYSVDPYTLSNVSSIVRNHFNTSFNPDWSIIATWLGVPPFPADRITYLKCAQFGPGYSEACGRTNSYQCILTTDGDKAYFICEYICRDVTWKGSAVIGFNLPQHFGLHPFSGKTRVNDIGCLNEDGDEIARNVLGYQISLDSYSNFIQDQLQICKKFIVFDFFSFFGIVPGISDSIPCPCWRVQARFDRRFRVIGDSTPDTVCYENRGGGQSVRCCYTNFILNTDLSLYTRYSQRLKPDLYKMFDSISSAIACSYSDSLKQEYYQLRRRNTCQGYRPPRFICIYGDPHYITLDNFEYTFNGFGEYILVRTLPSVSPSFELQGRTRTSLNVTQATILAGLAFQFKLLEVRMEILLEPSAPLHMNVTLSISGGMPINLTPMLLQQGDNYSNASLDIEVDTSNNFLITLGGSLSLIVSVKNGILDYLLALPPGHKYNTEGLMGTWNDNQEDDLIPYNSFIPISINASQRAIHYEFGQTWNLSITTPLFFYPGGQGSSSYTSNTFEPIFSDNITYSPEAIALCGASPPCLFDFEQTGNEMIATNSANQNTDFFVQQMGISNSPPFLILLNGSSEIRLIRGEQPHYFTVQLTDEDTGAMLQVNSNHSVFLPMVPGLVLSKQFTISLSLPQPASTPFFLSLIGIDAQGANASINFDLIACVCENGGMCRQGVYSFESVSLRYKLEACQCTAGYAGDLCETDADGCLQQECYPGVTCTDLPPPSISGQCGPCPTGTSGNGMICTDLNECVNESGLLHTCMSPSQTCVNVIGSFRCDCAQGYIQQAAGTCVDINECALNPCQQICENTDGGFVCKCHGGFQLNVTTGMCFTNQTCNLNCTNGVCGVVNGTQVCFCDSGYEKGSVVDNSCVDINECADPSLHSCEHICTNIEKSYTCSCRSGYILRTDSLSCGDFNECDDIFTVACPATEICVNTVGSHMCVVPMSPTQSTIPTQPTTSVPTTPSGAALSVSLLPLFIAVVLLQALFALL